MGFLEGVMNAHDSQTLCRVQPPRLVLCFHTLPGLIANEICIWNIMTKVLHVILHKNYE